MNWVEDNEVLKSQKIAAKHFNLKNQIKSMFATICNTYTVLFIVRFKLFV